MPEEQYEILSCNETGCNLHDFEIRAFGVCRYLDHVRRMEAKDPPDFSESIGEVVERVLDRVLPPLLDGLNGTRQQAPIPKPLPPQKGPFNQSDKQGNGGGIPL